MTKVRLYIIVFFLVSVTMYFLFFWLHQTITVAVVSRPHLEYIQNYKAQGWVVEFKLSPQISEEIGYRGDFNLFESDCKSYKKLKSLGFIMRRDDNRQIAGWNNIKFFIDDRLSMSDPPTDWPKKLKCVFFETPQNLLLRNYRSNIVDLYQAPGNP